MSAGNRARTRVKGFHLSADCCEMLEQLSIVIHDNESKHVEMAVREYFMKLYGEHRQQYGDDYWDKCLDQMEHVNKLKHRRKVLRVNDGR